MKEVKKIIYSLAILLFVSNYAICDFFYYNTEVQDIKKWWALKGNIYAVIIMLVFYASLIQTKGVLKLILNIGVGLCVSNVIDKCFFNVLQFRFNDIIMIVLTICFSVLTYLKEFKNARKLTLK